MGGFAPNYANILHIKQKRNTHTMQLQVKKETQYLASLHFQLITNLINPPLYSLLRTS